MELVRLYDENVMEVVNNATHYLARKEGRLAYTDYDGDGPLVLMLPGMGDMRSEYRWIAPFLHEAGYHQCRRSARAW